MKLPDDTPVGPPDAPILRPFADLEALRRQQDAFSEAIGLPVSLHSPGEFSVDPDDPRIPDFCRTMAQEDKRCEACATEHLRLQDPEGLEARTMKCFAGMSSSAIPIRIATGTTAYLHTGHVFVGSRDEAKWRRIVQGFSRTSRTGEVTEEGVRFFTESQYQSALLVLQMLARQLAEELSRQPVVPCPPGVARAIALIEKEPERHWTLEKLATRSHISPNYLSEMFRKTTGSTYTEYLARVRVQRAEAALRNPNRRVSEIAFAVGFRSLSQFNRAFRRIHGLSPREMRASGEAVGN